MDLYEIVNHLARHEEHINQVKNALEGLYDEEGQNKTYSGMIGYLDHRANTLARVRGEIESLNDYPGAALDQELHPKSLNAVKEALEHKDT